MVLKKKLLLLLASLMTLLALTACSSSQTAMIINGEKVPQGVFNYYLNNGISYLQSFGIDTTAEGSEAYLSMIEEQAVEIVKEVTVTRADALAKGIKITDEEINQLLADEKKTFTSDEEYQQWLTDQQITEADVKWILESSLLNDALYEDITKSITMTDEEIKAAYDANPAAFDSYTFSHILISVDSETGTEADWENAKAKAADIIKQLDGGADFATLAKENGTDGTAPRGGSLGDPITKETSTFVEEFNQAAFAMTTAGEHSKEPVKTTFGYHVIKLDNLTTGYENLKDNIVSSVKGAEKDDMYFAYLDELIAKVTIDKDYTRKYAAAPDNTNNDNAAGGNDQGATDGGATPDGTDPVAGDTTTPENTTPDGTTPEANGTTTPAK